mgnify:CR=1 FL=1
MKNIIKDTLILFAITLVAGLGLGLVYNVTANSRAMQEEKTKTEAYNTVMPGLGSFDNVSFDSVAADKYIKEQINKNETEKTMPQLMRLLRLKTKVAMIWDTLLQLQIMKLMVVHYR